MGFRPPRVVVTQGAQAVTGGLLQLGAESSFQADAVQAAPCAFQRTHWVNLSLYLAGVPAQECPLNF
jgi:hypothetical protein